MLLFILMAMACSKSSDNDAKDDEVKVTTETTGGITYKLFVKKEPAAFKGILVMGSGNDAENPSLGSLDGAAENELCQKAAQNNYVAAIVQYRKTPGLANWDASSTMIADDYDKCIVTLANHFDIQKERSVIGGYSYAAYMLLNNAAWSAKLAYCKGLLSACGAMQTGTDSYFHLPIYTITCSGNTDAGGLSGKALYDAIKNDSPFKTLSEGVTDSGCNTHCGGNWTNLLYSRMEKWLN